MKLRILVRPQDGPATQLELDVPKEGYLFGRDGEGVLANDPYCSRRHALLYYDSEGDLRIRDLSSRNGTFMRGRRVTGEAPVDDGGFRIGRTRVCILSLARPGQVSESILVRADYDMPKG